MTAAAPSRKAAEAAAKPDRASAGDQHRRPRRNTGRHAAVIAGGENVTQAGQVAHCFARLIFVGKLQRVPVRIWHHHVLGLAADPTSHVDMAIGTAGAICVDIETHAGVTFLAIAAAPAGDIKRHGNEIALLDELDVTAAFDYFTGDLVPKHHAGRRNPTSTRPFTGSGASFIFFYSAHATSSLRANPIPPAAFRRSPARHHGSRGYRSRCLTPSVLARAAPAS